jgi:hypothetical protein
MTEATLVPVEPPRRFHFGWVLPALFRPRATFAAIAEQASGTWLTPLLILTLFVIARVAVAGPLELARAQSEPVIPPPGFEFWSPEQQAQFFQAQQSASNPMLVYGFPMLGGVLGAWFSWVVTFGLLHLLLTLLGGRGSTRSTMNIVAWASLPFAVRDLVRIAAMLATRSPITHPGLSGFGPAENVFLVELFKGIDLYLLWHMILIVNGVTAADRLPLAKVVGGVLATIFFLLLLQAVPGFLANQLGQLFSGGF